MNKSELNIMNRWMQRNVSRFIDDCNEVNCTAMVEAWDSECSTGDATLKEDHPAWDAAFKVSEAWDAAQLAKRPYVLTLPN